jgi:hypothetical protein
MTKHRRKQKTRKFSLFIHLISNGCLYKKMKDGRKLKDGMSRQQLLDRIRKHSTVQTLFRRINYILHRIKAGKQLNPEGSKTSYGSNAEINQVYIYNI